MLLAALLRVSSYITALHSCSCRSFAMLHFFGRCYTKGPKEILIPSNLPILWTKCPVIYSLASLLASTRRRLKANATKPPLLTLGVLYANTTASCRYRNNNRFRVLRRHDMEIYKVINMAGPFNIKRQCLFLQRQHIELLYTMMRPVTHQNYCFHQCTGRLEVGSYTLLRYTITPPNKHHTMLVSLLTIGKPLKIQHERRYVAF